MEATFKKDSYFFRQENNRQQRQQQKSRMLAGGMHAMFPVKIGLLQVWLLAELTVTCRLEEQKYPIEGQRGAD